MSNKTLRIATRKSPLALWQAQHVQQQLGNIYPEWSTQLVAIETTGDRITDKPLAQVGGKGLFVKSLQQALLAGRADIAVHSLKDMPAIEHPDLHLAAFLERADARDAWVSNEYASLDALPAGATIGTGSPRRQCQIMAYRPDLNCVTLRGNVQTRLQKVQQTPLAGTLLAAAGLQRLQLEKYIRSYLPIEQHIPAIGQAIIAVECLAKNKDLIDSIAKLNHLPTAYCANAERAFNQYLQGSCFTPLAAHAYIKGGDLHLRTMLGNSSGHMWQTYQQSKTSQAEQCGIDSAKQILEQGGAAARAILDNKPYEQT